jgi:hypothetical protein
VLQLLPAFASAAVGKSLKARGDASGPSPVWNGCACGRAAGMLWWRGDASAASLSPFGREGLLSSSVSGLGKFLALVGENRWRAPDGRAAAGVACAGEAGDEAACAPAVGLPTPAFGNGACARRPADCRTGMGRSTGRFTATSAALSGDAVEWDSGLGCGGCEPSPYRSKFSLSLALAICAQSTGVPSSTRNAKRQSKLRRTLSQLLVCASMRGEPAQSCMQPSAILTSIPSLGFPRTPG